MTIGKFKGIIMKITEKMKQLIWEIISDLDRHFPDDALTDEYYNYFFKKYIIPCINESNSNTSDGLNDDWKMRNGEVL